MAEGVLLVEKRDHICTLTLDRPHKRNALSPELLTRLEDVLKGLATQEDVRVVVLRGAGDLAFSAGYDITRLEEETARRQEYVLPTADGAYRSSRPGPMPRGTRVFMRVDTLRRGSMGVKEDPPRLGAAGSDG